MSSIQGVRQVCIARIGLPCRRVWRSAALSTEVCIIGSPTAKPLIQRARQLAEALAVDQMLKDAHDAVFKEVRRYADQLAHLDPANHNAAQEVGHVAVMLCNAETPQERLDTLTHEAQRLMLAVANAKRERRITWIISAVIMTCGVCAAVALLT
jgi:hypothetical protein